MNPIQQLKRLLAGPPSQFSGEVVEALGADRYRVRGPGGVVEAITSGGLAFVRGDEVMVRDGVILGRVRSTEQVPVYRV